MGDNAVNALFQQRRGSETQQGLSPANRAVQRHLNAAKTLEQLGFPSVASSQQIYLSPDTPARQDSVPSRLHLGDIGHRLDVWA